MSPEEFLRWQDFGEWFGPLTLHERMDQSFLRLARLLVSMFGGADVDPDATPIPSEPDKASMRRVLDGLAARSKGAK